MEQIRIPEGLSDKLKGKTIEKTSFYNNTGDYLKKEYESYNKTRKN